MHFVALNGFVQPLLWFVLNLEPQSFTSCSLRLVWREGKKKLERNKWLKTLAGLFLTTFTPLHQSVPFPDIIDFIISLINLPLSADMCEQDMCQRSFSRQ